MRDSSPATEHGSPTAAGASDFEALVSAHRRELQVHCYRMLGGWTEAEDLLQPMPTPRLDVEARAEERQALGLAFAIALQHLPPRQRASLLLRDVVGCEASEVAAMLGTSAPAVNSALVRARDRMDRFRADHGDEPPVAPLDEEQRRVVDAYFAAWEAADVQALAALLSEEAVFSMPPYPTWYRGRAAVARALADVVFAGGRAFRLLPTSANGRPAFGVYRRGAAGPGLSAARDTQRTFTGTGIMMLVPDGTAIAHVVTFLDARLVPRFGLPAALGG